MKLMPWVPLLCIWVLTVLVLVILPGTVPWWFPLIVVVAVALVTIIVVFIETLAVRPRVKKRRPSRSIIWTQTSRRSEEEVDGMRVAVGGEVEEMKERSALCREAWRWEGCLGLLRLALSSSGSSE